MNKFIAIALLTACATTAHAADVTITADYGKAHYARCGVGCWEEPPLPSSAKQDEVSKLLAVEWYGVRVAYLTLNRGYAGGLFVLDANYNATTRTIAPGTTYYWKAGMAEVTRGVSLEYEHTFSFGAFSASPRAGLFKFRQTTYSVYTSLTELQHGGWDGGGVTPTAGIGVYYRIAEHAQVGLDADFYKGPRFRDSSLGGDPSWNTQPGLRTFAFGAKYTF